MYISICLYRDKESHYWTDNSIRYDNVRNPSDNEYVSLTDNRQSAYGAEATTFTNEYDNPTYDNTGER